MASVYVPNGGKDFGAKMRFLAALEDYAVAFRARGEAQVRGLPVDVGRSLHPADEGLFTW